MMHTFVKTLLIMTLVVMAQLAWADNPPTTDTTAPTVSMETATAATPAPTLNTGDTAWMLTSTALVLFMTIPGLSLFYAGMVRSKNVLSVMMQCFAITSLVTVLWTVFVYSLAFTDGGQYNTWIGGLDKVLLAGIKPGHAFRHYS
ncbi:MAG: hypothetical protein R3E08_07675 [Thiotrichaceae bacterium]